MTNKSSSSPTSFLNLKLKHYYLLAIAIIILANSIQLTEEIIKLNKIRKYQPYSFPGHQLLGLSSFLENSQYIGYYTDKNLSNNLNARQVAQAQYILAPIILDLNNIHHRYVLLDCTTLQKAWTKTKESNLVPYKISKTGIILTRNPDR